MIVVTGANGQLGRAVTERLLDRVPAGQVGVSVRDPERAQDLADRGVRVRRGDFGDPATLRDAFQGAEQVLVVSVNSLGEQAVAQHRAAIDAAVAVGADRVLYTSQVGAARAVDAAATFGPAVDHAATEQLLQESGIAFTSLRNGFYTSSAFQMVRGALASGELAVPLDGPVVWTENTDLADAAVAALTGGDLDGITPPLTATRALDMAEVAQVLGELTGRDVRRVVVSDEQYAATLVGHGAPPRAADMLVGGFAAMRAGAFAATDPTLERVIGRPATSFRDAVARLLADAGPDAHHG